MSAELHVRPDIPFVTWEEFTTSYPAGSIALDGFVKDAPRFEANGPYLNADHHEGVFRLATLSSAQQIQRSIHMGFDTAFANKQGEFAAQVFVNDCDQDVCTAWYLLDHIDQVKDLGNHALNRFISVAGTIDVTSCAFPYDPKSDMLEELNWVFEPFTDFRSTDDFSRRDGTQFRAVIDDVNERIDDHVNGRGKQLPLDTGYKVIGGGEQWRMIIETGSQGRFGAFHDGIDAFVIQREHHQADRWDYSIGRRSEFVPFDVPGLLKTLNQAELAAGNTQDSWGGNGIVGGSPRTTGSKLPPVQVEEIINDFTQRA